MLDTSTPKRPTLKAVPHSLEAERTVLGAALRNSDFLNFIVTNLEARHFYEESHRKIFIAISSLLTQLEPFDIETVSKRLREQNPEGSSVDQAYLVDLIEKCQNIQNIEYYVRIVSRIYTLRRIAQACENTLTALSSPDCIESSMEKIEEEFLSILNDFDSKGIERADKALAITMSQMQRRLESADNIDGVPTGLIKLDHITNGLQNGDLIVLAGRPGMGKTALALNVATCAALSGRSVVLFSLETTKEQLMSRVLSSVAQVDLDKLRKGDLNEKEQDRLMEAARKVYDSQEFLAIDETPRISVNEIISRCRRYQKEGALDLVIIDYLELVRGSRISTTSYEKKREITEINMSLKSLAKELGIPIMVLVQLNRGPDARTDKRPKLSDLRECENIDGDADLILFLYRDEYYNSQSELAGIAEVIVAKNRHGSTGTAKLTFKQRYLSFQNLFDDKKEVVVKGSRPSLQ
ncbi:MAG: replicative DNA helicase [Oligoflexales bacterium]